MKPHCHDCGRGLSLRHRVTDPEMRLLLALFAPLGDGRCALVCQTCAPLVLARNSRPVRIPKEASR